MRGSVNGAPSTVKFGAVNKSTSYKLIFSWSFLLFLRKLYSAKNVKNQKLEFMQFLFEWIFENVAALPVQFINLKFRVQARDKRKTKENYLFAWKNFFLTKMFFVLSRAWDKDTETPWWARSITKVIFYILFTKHIRFNENMHDNIDIADPCSIKDVCHIRAFVMDLCLFCLQLSFFRNRGLRLF